VAGHEVYAASALSAVAAILLASSKLPEYLLQSAERLDTEGA
jgi:hypothetical protein